MLLLHVHLLRFLFPSCSEIFAGTCKHVGRKYGDGTRVEKCSVACRTHFGSDHREDQLQTQTHLRHMSVRMHGTRKAEESEA